MRRHEKFLVSRSARSAARYLGGGKSLSLKEEKRQVHRRFRRRVRQVLRRGTEGTDKDFSVFPKVSDRLTERDV